MGFRAEDRAPVRIENCECVHATKDALKILVNRRAWIWVPKEAVHEDSEVYDEGHKGVLVIPRRMARQKGLVDEAEVDT